VAYTDYDFRTKKALKEHVAKLNDEGRPEDFLWYQPGPFGDGIQRLDPGSKTVVLEGPHYPAAHSWYASIQRDTNGKLVVK
jgi:hypothetical protein